MIVKDRAWCLPYTLGCLAALTVPKRSTRVLLIDDASTDDTGALLDAFRAEYGSRYASFTVQHRDGTPDPHATSARNTSDRLAGYPHLAELRNAALAWVIASTSVQWLSLDSDCLIAPDLVNGLAAHGQAYVGAMIFNDVPIVGNVGRQLTRRHTNAGGLFGRRWRVMDRYEMDRLYPCGYTGAVALATREAFASGARYGVNPINDQPCEDYAFCWGLEERNIWRYVDTTRRAVHVMDPAYLEEALGVYHDWFGVTCPRFARDKEPERVE